MQNPQFTRLGNYRNKTKLLTNINPLLILSTALSLSSSAAPRRRADCSPYRSIPHDLVMECPLGFT